MNSRGPVFPMTAVTLTLNGALLAADLSGALFWAERKTLVVADLHLEKGSGLAARGCLLPPYDTARTLDLLAGVVARYAPETLVCLGDSFHDPAAGGRVLPLDGARIARMTGTCDWIWVVGNHDPHPPDTWGGRVAREFRLGPLTFRHKAAAAPDPGEVSGHYHPVGAVRTRLRRLRSRCFVTDGVRLVLPAFGAFTGGLNVRDPAVERLFPRGYEVVLLGGSGLYRFPRARLSPDVSAGPPGQRGAGLSATRTAQRPGLLSDPDC